MDDCDDCTPSYLKQQSFGTRAAFSTLPFCATFLVITIVAYRKVYPLLSSSTSAIKQNGPKSSQPTTLVPEPSTQTLARRIAAATFASTIALSAVLTELLLCEISNSFNPTARSIALQITVASLLGLLVVAIPLLGISSVVSKSGYKFGAEQRGRRRLAWMLEFGGYGLFLIGFWFIGALLPQTKPTSAAWSRHATLFQACLDRLGITGVSLMALLSGFASVSAVWQNFGPKTRLVSEADINRKQAGLDATVDMLAEKKMKLHRLEEKLVGSSSKSFWTRTVGTFRSNADTQEKCTLEMEISGLETMSSSLETTLSVLRTRRADQLRMTTKIGRLQVGFSYIFSFYCVYRIATTTVSILRRVFLTTTSSRHPDTDPVTHGLALVARYVYPSLDRDSWAQQISFLLSGAMLLASFTAVTQTFHLFSRFLPSMLQATKTNFALLISQISGMYVISSALMMRSMMPKEVGSVINGALGAGLMEPAWVSRWFEGFFILSVSLTAGGIWAGRTFGGTAFEDQTWDGGDVEMGKQS